MDSVYHRYMHTPWPARSRPYGRPRPAGAWLELITIDTARSARDRSWRVGGDGGQPACRQVDRTPATSGRPLRRYPPTTPARYVISMPPRRQMRVSARAFMADSSICAVNHDNARGSLTRSSSSVHLPLTDVIGRPALVTNSVSAVIKGCRSMSESPSLLSDGATISHLDCASGTTLGRSRSPVLLGPHQPRTATTTSAGSDAATTALFPRRSHS